MSKIGVNRAEVPHHVQVWELEPPKLFESQFCAIHCVIGGPVIFGFNPTRPSQYINGLQFYV